MPDPRPQGATTVRLGDDPAARSIIGPTITSSGQQLFSEAEILNAARCAGVPHETWLRIRAYLPVIVVATGSAG